MSRVLETFLDLVRIDSPTGSESEVATYVRAALEDLGLTVRTDDTKDLTGADTGNLIVSVPGSTAGPVIAFSAHMDCVQPCEGVEPVVEGGTVRTAGETVLGGDDKVGVAAMIEATRRLMDSTVPHAPLKLLFTVSEEQGLRGAKALSAGDASADVCLVLDADGDVGGIVVGAPTHYTFKATFNGRAAHAGVEPEKGISAIALAAGAIERMELGRLDEGTTANIGTISGGSATNVVAPLCEMTGECRSRVRERVEEVRASMEAAMREGAAALGGSVDIVWALEYEGFSVEGDAPAITLVEASCADIGVVPRRFTTGGGSDANVMAALGMETLVLSSGMSKVHTTGEVLEVAQLERLADLLVAVARRAAG